MDDNLLELTADIVSAYVEKNAVPASDLAALIGDVSAALQRVSSSAVVNTAEKASAAVMQTAEKKRAAVNVKKSLHNDYMVCLEDGLKFKSLKRHLMAHHGLTPEAYRTKWGLPPSYPMVAPAYAARRSVIAKETRLGVAAGGSKASRDKRKQSQKTGR